MVYSNGYVKEKYHAVEIDNLTNKITFMLTLSLSNAVLQTCKVTNCFALFCDDSFIGR